MPDSRKAFGDHIIGSGTPYHRHPAINIDRVTKWFGADNPISFWDFTRKGIAVTIVSIALSALYLWLRYFVVG